MRLDMANSVANRARHTLQGADLVDDHLFNVRRLFALDLAPAKAPDIKETRMRADLDTILKPLFHPPLPLPEWPSEDRRTRMVFITRDLPRDAIEMALAAFEHAAAEA